MYSGVFWARGLFISFLLYGKGVYMKIKVVERYVDKYTGQIMLCIRPREEYILAIKKNNTP